MKFHTHGRKLLLTTTAAVAAIAFSPSAMAQDAPGATGDTGDNTIVVLGTRRTDRTVTDSASPVDVISADELNAQASNNVIDSLKNIVPSFYAGQNTISDASTFVRSPSLRGLPGDNVLVMLNGKRYNRSALVQVYGGSDSGLSLGSHGSDISAIPSIAVSNLQILREGATAQYGSDAIAGVMNFGLKEKTGLEVTGRYGQYYAGDGDSYQVAADVGFGLFGRGFINVAGEYTNDGQTSRGVTRPSAYNFAQLYPSQANLLPNYPGPVQIWGSSPSETYKFVVNSAFDVTDSAKLYFFGNYAHVDANESFNYRPSITSTATDSNGVVRTQSRNSSFNTIYLTPCPAATPTCPVGGYVANGATFNFSSIYPAGFTPRFYGTTEQLFGTLGLKGDLGKLTYDLSGSLSRNSLSLSMTNSLNASYGPQSQTSFDFGSIIQKEANLNLDVSYPIEVGFSSPLTLAGGLEWRKETFQLTEGDVQSYGVGPYAGTQTLYTMVSPGVYTPAGTSGAHAPGASGYGGTSPQAAGKWSQTSYAGYVSLETDVTSALTLGAAGRYEHYNTFGDAWVGKANALLKLTDFLSVRASVGNGFHAPSPGQSNDAILTTGFTNGTQVQIGTYPVNTAISQYYGAKPLKPEDSFNLGVGVILNPVRAMTITVDAYSIKVNNRIFITQPFSVTAADVAAQPALAAVGVGGSVTYFTNGLDTKTQGIDVVATYRTELSGAKINFTLAYNYNKTDVTDSDPNVISDAQKIDAAKLAPNHRAVFTTNWSYGAFSINARENYYGSWRSAQDYGVNSQTFGAKFTTDLDVSYKFADVFTVTVGAQNLTDEKPDRLTSQSVPLYPITGGGTSDGQLYPRNGGPFGFNGGFYYVKLGIKL